MATTINDQMRTTLTSLASNKSKSTSANQSLNLQTTDWMTLLVAQLKNQDMYNTTDSSEYTTQMAQYSMIQALNNLTSVGEEIYANNYTSYASSLVGKEVTVAQLDKDKKLVTETGTVTGVTLFEGEPKVYIGKNAYSLSEIMTVGKIDLTPQTPTPNNTGGNDANNTAENTGDSGANNTADNTGGDNNTTT